MTRFAIILAAGVSAVALASAAHAADLIISEPAPIGVVEIHGQLGRRVHRRVRRLRLGHRDR